MKVKLPHGLAWWLLTLVACIGCKTHGFDRSHIDSQWTPTGATAEVTDQDIREVETLKPQLMFPCRIAVFLEEDYHRHWTKRDKEVMEGWAQTLQREGIASEVVIMTSDSLMAGNEKTDKLKRIRLEAARYGADALLVLQAGYDVDAYLNPAAVLNLTIVGMFVVPASHRDALVVVRGKMFDVRNGYLYLSQESAGEAGIVRPTAIIEDKDAIEMARRKALAQFGPELLQRLRNLRARAVGAVPSGPPPVTVPSR